MATTKPKLLVIDDEEGVRTAMKLLLEEEYDIVFAENGDEGIKIVSNPNDIDLITVDMKMPGKNGIETIVEIRKINKTIPLVVVSGWDAKEVMYDSIQSGANGFITKPLKQDNVLKELLNARKAK